MSIFVLHAPSLSEFGGSRLTSASAARSTPAISTAKTKVEVPNPLYWSATRIGRPGEGRLESISLTPSPARIFPQQVRFLEGRLEPGHSLGPSKYRDQAPW